MRTTLVSLLLPLTLAAQSPQTPQFDFLVPLHTAPDDPVSGPYGLWASGPDYKASFHDGLAFYPVRGPDRELVRLHWRTESIRVGAIELKSGQPTPQTGEWRHELDHGAVTEVYDVLREGVEQSFVLDRPVGSGDVVVIGRIEGDLQTAASSAATQALEFCNGEGALVRYGKAVAFDAAGRRTSVTTAFDGDRIQLRLEGSFLEGATYPVTIDPLLSAVGVNTNMLAPVSHSSIAADNSSATGKVWASCSRTFASGDDDAYGLLCNKDFSGAQMIFMDLSINWSTPHTDVAHVDGANRWVVAMQRDYSPTDRQIRVYCHDQGNTSFMSGTTLFPSAPFATRWQKPKVSGRRGAGNMALIVFEEESNSPSGGTWIEPHYSLVNPVVPHFFGAQQLYQSTNSGLHWRSATIVPTAQATDDWTVMVVYEDGFFPGSFGTYIAFIDTTGTNQHDYTLTGLGVGTVGNLAIAGTRPDRLMLAWTRTDSGTRYVETRRVDGALSGTPGATVGPVRTITSSSLAGFGSIDLACDWDTDSHWALTYTRTIILAGTSAFIARLGHTGGVTESATLASSSQSARSPSICYAQPTTSQRFLAALGTTSGINRYLIGREFTYPASAATTAYGTVCHPTASLVSLGNRRPYAGDEYFGFTASPVLVNELAIFVVGFSPTSIPLGQYGFPAGCSLAVNSAFSFVAFNNSFFANSVSVGLPLPDAPVFIGDLFVQAAILPAGGGAPFVTQGMGVQVR